jgi:hypothetical protein
MATAVVPRILSGPTIMIESPFRYEKNFTAKDYEILGKLSLRWSHIDHVLANCLKRLLRLEDDEAQAIVITTGSSSKRCSCASAGNANNAAPANIDRTVFIVAIPALITVPNLPPPPFTAAQADFRLARAFR